MIRYCLGPRSSRKRSGRIVLPADLILAIFLPLDDGPILSLGPEQLVPLFRHFEILLSVQSRDERGACRNVDWSCWRVASLL